MKKYLPFAVTAMAILGLGSLTSCQNEDFDVSSETLKERAFEHGFAEEFGQPSADQRWDFYAQLMESLRGGEVAATRADGDSHVYNGITLKEDANGVAVVSNDVRVTHTTRETHRTYWASNNSPYTSITYNPNNVNSKYNSAVVQPELNEALIREWEIALPESDNNTGKGTTGFTLKSPKSGLFTVSAVMFQGMWSRLAYMQKFIFGIEVNGTRYPLFGGGGLYDGETRNIVNETWNTANPNFYPHSNYYLSDRYDAEYDSNPNWASYVYITPGTTFNFYFTY